MLFIGDAVALIVSLYFALWIRSGVAPAPIALTPYLAPFTFLFALWLLIFFSAGLYDKRIILFPSRLPGVLVGAHVVNMLLASAFFFTIPVFGIAPKTILALYLIVSLVLIFTWRLGLYPRFSTRTKREPAVLIAHGTDADALYDEVNGNPRYGIEFHSRNLADVAEGVIVVDRENVGLLPLEDLARAGRHVVAFEDLFEEVFDRIPLSKIEKDWFRWSFFAADSAWYAATKRAIDIVGGLLMCVVTLLVAPLIALANMFEAPGPLFIAQERFGRGGSSIRAYKFRSMRQNKSASGEWTVEERRDNPITRVGAILRKTSLDEFPQCVNVLKGELSLIGPRNDTKGLGRRVAEMIPYYMMRYAVTPGITGWAQINQQYEPGNVSPQSVEETKMRLAYDFYYIRHRSLVLDTIIALKTVKRMFFRVSSW